MFLYDSIALFMVLKKYAKYGDFCSESCLEYNIRNLYSLASYLCLVYFFFLPTVAAEMLFDLISLLT